MRGALKVLAVAVVAAAMAVAQAVTVDPPTQVHLAFAGDDAGRSDGMSFMWATNSNTTTTTVRYGLSPAPEGWTDSVTGSQGTYWQTWLHKAQVTGLAASTRYWYQVGDQYAGWSDVRSFVTAPAADDETPFKVAVVADMGVNHEYEQGYATRQALSELVAEDAVNFTIHAGDIFYADDAFLVDPFTMLYEDIWNRGATIMENITDSKAYMTCPGNHEAECHSPTCQLDGKADLAFNNFTAYNARFDMPSSTSGGVKNMWYSYNYGLASFISIDTETDFPGAPGDQYNKYPNGGFGDQLAWVEKALQEAAAARAQRPWIIVYGHRPIYSLDATNDQGEPVGAAASFQKYFEPLFYKYGVDLYICGHVHGSELSWPTYQNTVVQKDFVKPVAPVYVVIGGAGNIENLTDYGKDPNATSIDWNTYVNGAGVGDGGDYVLGLMTISKNALTFDYRKSVDLSVDKTFTITK